MKLANGTGHSLSQILRYYIDQGLLKDHEKIEKINCGPKYNIYKPNFLKHRHRHRHISNELVGTPKDKLDHSLISPLTDKPLILNDPDEARFLSYLDQQVRERAKE